MSYFADSTELSVSPKSPSKTALRKQLRQQMRQARHQLSAIQQLQAAENIAQQAFSLLQQIQAEHTALYLAFDGEISTQPLIELLWRHNKKVYLPVLHPFSAGELLFLRYLPTTAMQQNQFAIWQPKLDVSAVLPSQYLDVIFTPLVAFDKQGNRLGMGGGFYDRTLQDWQQKQILPIGLAHQCQEVPHIPTEIWDIPLAEILVG